VLCRASEAKGRKKGKRLQNHNWEISKKTLGETPSLACGGLSSRDQGLHKKPTEAGGVVCDEANCLHLLRGLTTALPASRL